MHPSPASFLLPSSSLEDVVRSILSGNLEFARAFCGLDTPFHQYSRRQTLRGGLYSFEDDVRRGKDGEEWQESLNEKRGREKM